MMPGEVGRQDCARGRIDTVGVEVHELDLALACHVSLGLHIAHVSVIGRLWTNI